MDGVEVVDVDISDVDAPSISEVDASILESADAIDVVAVAADDVDDVEITPSDDLLRVLVPNLAAIMGGAMADAETPMRSCNSSLCDDIVVITHSTAIANNIEDIVERRRLVEALQQYVKY